MLVLSKTIGGVINVPTAQDAFTFYGATTGMYEITGSLTSGAYPSNLCFDVFRPDGTSTALGSCTKTFYGITTVQKDVPPPQDGTYVVVAYDSINSATIGYDLDISCLVGDCPPPPPECVLTDTPTYNGQSDTLTMKFTVGTPFGATWKGWLIYEDTVESLWSQWQKIIEPPDNVTKTHVHLPSPAK
jgi:hypothetical protein